MKIFDSQPQALSNLLTGQNSLRVWCLHAELSEQSLSPNGTPDHPEAYSVKVHDRSIVIENIE
jgi:hypothetical protein